MLRHHPCKNNEMYINIFITFLVTAFFILKAILPTFTDLIQHKTSEGISNYIREFPAHPIVTT